MSEPSSKPRGIQPRRLCYATLSFCLGAWTFYKINQITGPVFEPIVAACQDPDISPGDFAQKTGYHSYEPVLGLGAFNMLVCLITQFLLELRETYPAGLLTWGALMDVVLPLNTLMILTAGRRGAKGPVRYPTGIGLLSQLLGISVVFPLLYNPSYFFSGSKFGVPVSNRRITAGWLLTLPATILTFLVFSIPTDSYAWTVSAGMLGGPIVCLMGLVLWTDKSSSIEATPQSIANSSGAAQAVYSSLAAVTFLFWLYLVAVAYQAYGFAPGDLWREIWVEAGPSVAFMTIDAGVLFLGTLLFIAHKSERRAIEALFLVPLVGPGAASCMALGRIERDAASALLAGEGKSD